MKSAIKVFVIIGASLIGIGLLLTTVSFATTGFNLESFSVVSDMEEQTETYSSDSITAIETNLSNQSVEIKRSKTDEIIVTYYTNEKQRITCEKNNNTIRVESEKNPINFTFGFSFIFNRNKVTIEIPETYRNSIDIKSSNGSIKVSDIELYDTVELKTSNASITLEDITIQSELNAASSNGSIRATNCKATQASFKTSNASIKAIQVDAKNRLSLDSSNGSIRVEEIKSNKIELETSNASIKGTILGNQSDFSIRSSTKNASNNLSNQTTSSKDKTLKVDTSNGSIDIDFVEE